MFTFRRVAAIATLTLALSSMADAQPFGSGRGMMGPGMMIGPGIMNRGGLGRMCDPATAGFAEWRISRLEQLIKPTDAQRLKLDELKAASTKASEAMRSACPTDIPATMPGRMEAMEKRMEGHAAGGQDSAAGPGRVLCHAYRPAKGPNRFELWSWPLLALA